MPRPARATLQPRWRTSGESGAAVGEVGRLMEAVCSCLAKACRAKLRSRGRRGKVNRMGNFIRRFCGKLGCFIGLALIMVTVTAVSRTILGWLGHDDASRETLSRQIGDNVGY